MKQKIYSFVIICISILIFSCFSVLSVDDEESSEEFELIFVSGTGETSAVITTSLSGKTSLKISSEKYTSKQTKTETAAFETTETTETAVDFPETETESESEPVFPININTAGYDELTALKGIGEVTALAIIDYRETFGDFRNRDELLNVDGIGEVRLAEIYDFIFVENETFDYNDISEPDSSDDTYKESEVYDEPEQEYTEYEEYSAPETEQTESGIQETSGNLPVNLNTASKEELMTLPYVDEKIADEILELRNTIQYFSHPYELLMIESLTQENVAEIINFVTVD